MRTTLTLDDDVARRVERVSAEAGQTWKETVNRLLRAGLDLAEAATPTHVHYQISPVSTGAPKVDVSRIGELNALEDEASWGLA